MEPKSATKINTFSIEFPNSTEMKTRKTERELYKFSLKCSPHPQWELLWGGLERRKKFMVQIHYTGRRRETLFPTTACRFCFRWGRRRRREGKYFINGSYENVVRVSLEIKVVCGNCRWADMWMCISRIASARNNFQSMDARKKYFCCGEI